MAGDRVNDTYDLLIYVNDRSHGEAQCTVHGEAEPGKEAPYWDVTVDDNEPDDVITPILQRATEEAGFVDGYVENVCEVERIEGEAYLVKVRDRNEED